ncbi:MAG: DNA primase [Acidimicrobiia bacterium]|nr:DNA primase [Acidimicrobiia bacterium]
MAYARDDIDLVRDKTDLVELAAEITKVRRSGRSTMAVCPFHSEKTPSLSIDGARGLYHCFGCGKSGDVYRWVQETQGLDFAGAVEFLARRAGVTLKVDPQAAKRRSQREQLVEATERAVAFYNDRLKAGTDAGPARAYVRGRGYDVDVVDRFSLGYSPSAWDELVKQLRSEGIKEDAMYRAGLATRSSRGSLIDRFRGRLMFPIFDLRGDPVGFGARVLDGDGPKYLNSAESPIYHKSRLLYGLNWAKSSIVREDTSVVVEGYTDVIGMHLAEMPIAVATCGTAIGEEHLDLLRRFSERVVFAFDADEAGAGAALRGFDRSVPGDLDLRVAELPEGKDPADVVAEGRVDDLERAVTTSKPLLGFRIERELARYNLDEPEARAKAVRSVAGVIATHPDPVTRHEYAVTVSKSTGVELAYVEAAIRRGNAPIDEAPPPDEPVGEPADPATLRPTMSPPERELLRVVLANDARLAEVELGRDLFGTDATRAAFDLASGIVAGLAPGDPPDLGSALADDGSEASALLMGIALDPTPLAEPTDLVRLLQVAMIDRDIAAVRMQLQQTDQSTDGQGYSDLLERLVALEQAKRELRSDP